MTEHPVLFSAPMVRAILEGRKTQTRRVARLTDAGRLKAIGSHKNWHPDDPEAIQACPYGKPGDRLWVREKWCVGKPMDNIKASDLWKGDEFSQLAVDYAANDKRIWGTGGQGKWRPSIFMPQWASRITLEVEEVRVQRVQEINEEDAKAEGATSYDANLTVLVREAINDPGSYTANFRDLWDTINASRGFGWDVNPWVWAITFRWVKR